MKRNAPTRKPSLMPRMNEAINEYYMWESHSGSLKMLENIIDTFVSLPRSAESVEWIQYLIKIKNQLQKEQNNDNSSKKD